MYRGIRDLFRVLQLEKTPGKLVACSRLNGKPNIEIDDEISSQEMSDIFILLYDEGIFKTETLRTLLFFSLILSPVKATPIDDRKLTSFTYYHKTMLVCKRVEGRESS